MIEALELAVILVQVVVPGSETAGREGEWNLAEGKNLGFDIRRFVTVQRFDQAAGCFQRRNPAFHPVAGKGSQTGLVVNIEVWPSDKIVAIGQIDCAEVIGFDHAIRNVR